MEKEENLVDVFDKKDFRKWLSKNHDKEKNVNLVIHKKHTGKAFPSHRELMGEAICFGWIDTTIKRLDGDRYIRRFVRRSDKSRWSNSTLNYARQLIKEKRMTRHGLKFYEEGLKKPVIDHNLPKNPEIPRELAKALKKNKKAREKFEKLAPSSRRVFIYWVMTAKLPETKKKRIREVVKRVLEGRKF